MLSLDLHPKILKILKRLPAVHGRPVITNCGKSTEKTFEFVDFYLKPKTKDRWSYIRDSSYAINKIKSLNKILDSKIPVTADVASLYPSILHESGLNAMKEALDSNLSYRLSSLYGIHIISPRS